MSVAFRPAALPCVVAVALTARFASAQFAAATIDSSTLSGMSARTLSEVLAGRVPSVTVLRSSGTLGAGSRVRMRGGSGLVIPREPLLVIDGVRVDASQKSLGIDIGGQTPSRLDDIPLDDVARIEALPGPVAAALYGTDAAGGVIVVTTKRGTAGRSHWSSYAESGFASDATSYPANFATGPPDFGNGTCTRADAATGTCTPGPLSRWNPIESASPFRTGIRLAGGANASGGWDGLRYYFGGMVASDQGPLAPNDQHRHAARATIELDPMPAVHLVLRGSLVGGRTTFPVGDTEGALYAGLMGNTADDPARRGYYFNDAATIASVDARQRIARSLGSVEATWSPVRWLTARGLVGREIVRRDDSEMVPMAVAYGDPSRDGPFMIHGATGRDLRTTVDLGVTAAYSLGSRVRGTTSAGIERLTQSFRARDSLNLFLGLPSTGGSSLLQSHASTRVAAVLATQQVDWGPRHLIVGIRRDDGDRRQFLKAATYWSANGSWALADEPFFHRSRAVDGLTLRAGYGVAGDSRPLARVLSSAFVVLPPPAVGIPAPTLASFAPERVSELELGLDASSREHRVTLGATWYRQRSGTSYERGCCVGPFFYDDQGSWHTTGIELVLGATFHRSSTTRLDSRATFATMRNRYDGGSSRQSRTLDDRWFSGGRRRLVPGYPIAGVWGRPTVGRDANGDGVIVSSEIALQRDSVYVGSSIPSRQAGLATSFTFLRWLTLAAQADYVGGFKSLDATESYRCGLRTCAALYSPDASVSDQTRAVAPFQQSTAYYESADFVRLRELSLTWVLAPDWSRRHGLDQLALTVAGRNLFLSTGYSGLDPEVNALGQSSFGATEFFTLPVPRTVVVRLAVQR